MKETTITRVEWSQEKHEDGLVTTRPRLTLACGHVTEPAAHFSYRIGDRWRCFACHKQANVQDDRDR